ncbi:MAG: sulfatase-like hydrolase/transferase, partial [Planctomycetes bacterium]|nr:sulfatase-like hydrolase/transferase [Planctomycetota bacterium]
MNKTFRFICLLWLLLPAWSARGAAPNVVIFIADDQGMGDLSCYGHPTLKTPHIDRLAEEGMLFESAFLTISSCSPTRCSLLTGRYPHNTGAEDLHVPLPADQKTMARYLQGAGYYTLSVGKWHLGNAEKRHWDRIVECAGSETGRDAVTLLRERPRDKPFFFWVASKDPHRPFGQDNIDSPYSSEEVIVPPYLPDHPLIREEIAQYYDEIPRLAPHVGQVPDEPP